MGRKQSWDEKNNKKMVSDCVEIRSWTVEPTTKVNQIYTTGKPKDRCV